MTFLPLNATDFNVCFPMFFLNSSRITWKYDDLFRQFWGQSHLKSNFTPTRCQYIPICDFRGLSVKGNQTLINISVDKNVLMMMMLKNEFEKACFNIGES